MTKVEAIAHVMSDNGGVATLSDIYREMERYYPAVKAAHDWEAGVRGVLYREIRNGRRFKKIGLSIYALQDYEEEKKPKDKDKVRMHSYIEGICLELGNLKRYKTYTADPTALYRDNLQLGKFTTIDTVPPFTYDEIVTEVKRIDVVWFNSKGLLFPQRVFEVVDSIGTLDGAFNRSLQLNNFRTEFYIVAPERHRQKFEQTIRLERYNASIERFRFINYDQITDLYDSASRTEKIESKIFG